MEEAGLFGREIWLEIINDFLLNHEKQIEKVDIDLKVKDYQALECNVHRLKGSIANFYVKEIPESLGLMEKKAAEKDIADLEKFGMKPKRILRNLSQN